MFNIYLITQQLNLLFIIIDCFYILIINVVFFLLIINTVNRLSQINSCKLQKFRTMKRRDNKISKFNSICLKTNKRIVKKI